MQTLTLRFICRVRKCENSQEAIDNITVLCQIVSISRPQSVTSAFNFNAIIVCSTLSIH